MLCVTVKRMRVNTGAEICRTYLQHIRKKKKTLSSEMRTTKRALAHLKHLYTFFTAHIFNIKEKMIYVPPGK